MLATLYIWWKRLVRKGVQVNIPITQLSHMSSIKKNVRIRTIATCRNIFVRACLIATCRNQKNVAKCRNKCLAWKRRLANQWTEKIVLTPSTFTIWFWKIWSSLWQMVCSFHFFNTLYTYKNLIIFFSLYLDMLL